MIENIILTWGLDFDYDPQAESGPIIDWLKEDTIWRY